MAAAALRSAATKVCGRAFERPNSYFTTALKEEQRRLLQRISHGRSSLRRFSSSESPNLLNNNKHLPTNNAEPLTRQIQEKKQELLHLLRQADHPKCAMELENKKLLHLLGRTPGPAPVSTIEFVEKHLFKIVTGTLGATAALLYIEAKFIFPLFIREEEQPSLEKAK
nr:uncharacterized protein LOC127345516 [Lolium perenne]